MSFKYMGPCQKTQNGSIYLDAKNELDDFGLIANQHEVDPSINYVKVL